tara:strand:+ start:240 stop:515 length:276 start_codon:yes stop_codon:yes gene_type:complete
MEILQQLGSLPIFIIMFLIIYFLMIRPQSQQQKKHSNMINNLKKGDKIVTRGGLIGKVVDFQGTDNKNIVIEVGNNTKVNVLRSYVATLLK